MAKVIWCDRGFQPLYYGFCPDEAAWKREMKRLKVECPYPTTDGRCTSFDNAKGGDKCILVTIAKHIDRKHDKVAIAALVAHEAVHVWQHVKEAMGETEPSREFEAYAVQHIFLQLLSAYSKTRKRI